MKILSNTQYRELIHEKDVCIVGPAGYLKDYSFGHEIDKHSTIIRLSNGLSLCDEHPLHVGTKTTILFTATCYHPNQKIYHTDYLNYILSKNIVVRTMNEYYFPLPFARDKRNFITHLGHIPIYVSFIDEADSFFLTEIQRCFDPKLKTWVSIGTIALVDTLFHLPKSIMVYGLSFNLDNNASYLSKNYNMTYAKVSEKIYKQQFLNRSAHDWKLEKTIWKNIVSTHSVVNTDPYMNNLLFR